MVERGEPPGVDLLATTEAGGKAIRGGAIRIGGYGVGLALSLVSVPLLTRHLGVRDFGGYVTVLSLVTIVAIVAEAGLTVIGIREYSVRRAQRRDRLIANIVSLRLLMAGLGTLFATGFAVAAGYDSSLVAGTALAGVGVILALVQQTYTIPLAAELRWGIVSGFELLRQALSVAAILVLIGVGAGVTAFLASSIPVGLVVVAVTAVVLSGRVAVWPAIDLSEWRRLVRETALVAAATMLGALFYRVAVIVTSIFTTAEETGYFSVSFRVIEVVVAVAALVTKAAFPILVRTAADERERFVYGMQRLFEIGLILGSWSALVLFIGAEPVIWFVGGGEFDRAVPVLQIQGIATAASFLFAVWAAGLWALGAQRGLALASAAGVVSVGVLTAALAASEGAVGAAVAMTISGLLLAALAGALLMRDRHLRVKLGILPKVAVALAAGLLVVLLPLPPLLLVVIASVLYFALLAFLRAIPPDVRHAFLKRSGAD
jgi:O-antigen/teichoic acid export membrane protein